MMVLSQREAKEWDVIARELSKDPVFTGLVGSRKRPAKRRRLGSVRRWIDDPVETGISLAIALLAVAATVLILRQAWAISLTGLLHWLAAQSVTS